VRTSWLTGSGGRNFVHRIQQLADEHGSLKVVTDEVASPTFVPDLVTAILQLIETNRYGIYHFVNSGYCSRFDYARKILALTGRSHIPVEPITLADYPRPSTPPKFSSLLNQAGAALGITLSPWEDALEKFLAK
jgi:dTDP-4-dehydrorhamnose reductase